MSPSKTQRLKLSLYVFTSTQRSKRAVRNIRDILSDLDEDHYDITIVNLEKDPRAAEENDILATPTLVREAPAPQQRLIGDLSERETVVYFLDIDKNINRKDAAP